MKNDRKLNPLFKVNLNAVTGENDFDYVKVIRKFDPTQNGACIRTELRLITYGNHSTVVILPDLKDSFTGVSIHILFILGWLPESYEHHYEVESDRTLKVLTQRFVPRYSFNPDNCWALTLKELAFRTMTKLAQAGLKLQLERNGLPTVFFQSLSDSFAIVRVVSTDEDLDFVYFDVKLPLEDILSVRSTSP